MSARSAAFHTGLLAALGVTIRRLVTDNREIAPGDTFVAYPGQNADGRHFIAQAIAAGANAVIWEADKFAWNDAWRIPNLGVRDLRHHAGQIADFVYGAPSQALWMVGVTGTNGKTSCSHWLAQSFGALGRRTALLGTLGNGFPGALQATLNTTPDAIRIHGLLADYLRAGAKNVVMEVSSHALAQGRVNAVKYDVALLTNLSRDHLDYHGDMESYAAAKRRLFDWAHLKYAVLNLDDAFGAELAVSLQNGGAELIGYGLGEAALRLAEARGMRMVHGCELQMRQNGMGLKVHTSWGRAELESQLVGRFNASNLLGALAVLLVSGIELQDAVRELGRVRAAPGRMQSLGGAGRPAVVVDYAHTPDALAKVLQSLREAVQGSGKLVCVFGCGGDRDRGKRPMMGQVASKWADACIVTTDNPRNEEPQDIIGAIVAGMERKNYRVVADRAEAIALAIGEAAAADTVLLAGKGHETYQEVRGERLPFSDMEMAQRALATWGAGA
jgi:UDP-N-acetylmuramoyl-L-alanyl-D-glutamate--2,6-diaminopimelate ligase